VVEPRPAAQPIALGDQALELELGGIDPDGKPDLERDVREPGAAGEGQLV
jgi:hypothetical protein